MRNFDDAVAPERPDMQQTLPQRVGAQIRSARKRKKLTLLQLARRCGTTPQTIQRLMTIEEVNVLEDKKLPGVWRVEAFDEEGTCYITRFETASDAEAYALQQYGRLTVATATTARRPTPVRIP
jgi:hypothetical protein